MNLVVGQNFTTSALSGSAKLSDSYAPPLKSAELATGEGLKATNQFAQLLRGLEVRSEPIDFSCSGYFEVQLTKKADSLVAKLEAALQGIVTRVEVDNLCMLKLCVNALVVEGAQGTALKYACIAKEWCRLADFTDSVATGTALTATAEMFFRLRSYEEAARLFKSSTAAFAGILDYEHPLTCYSRKRHKMTLTKLAFSDRSKVAAAYGAGYLKATERQNLCPLVWEGPQTL
ncbi:MAG: hypothetical protein C0469_01165 [Cyanobacteria bacterium DS2.3.42]|nr:hypothetical protein [Cyanobacteria bacterium DS2.3.42]